MGFANDVAIGFKSIFFGNGDQTMFDIADIDTLPKELRDSIKDISDRASAAQKRIAGGIRLSSSERIITAPDIPVIGSIVAAWKKAKVNKQLRKKIEEKDAEGKSALQPDSIVRTATETNPYTNPNGKGVVRTQGASNLTNTPREKGGEERNRLGH